MRPLRFSFAVLLIAFAAAAGAREIRPLNDEWKFQKGDVAGAESPSFDASAWRTVDVPHDWAIEGPWDSSNPTGSGGGYVPSGVARYRKTVNIPSADQGKRVMLQFDGVMAHSSIYVNGQKVGGRPNGYIPTVLDVTDQIKFGSDNVIAVKADTSIQPASRWNAGAGIYRKVNLIVADPLQAAPWGVYITTPVATKERAVVAIRTEVINKSTAEAEIGVKSSLKAPDGTLIERTDDPATRTNDETQPVFRTLGAGETAVVTEYFNVANPALWNTGDPKLYAAVTKVMTSAKDNDVVETPFGIRNAEFRPDTGFWLNGTNIKLKGVCLHSDGGAVGAAVPTDIWEYRLTNLRKAGVNAIRCAHNPPSQDFLDLCDRMGFLVMDEMYDAWKVGKPGAGQGLNTYFEATWEDDLRDAVKRDRNHPSVILWSAGNEIHDTPREEDAKQTLAKIVAAFKLYDPDTAVTQALFRPNVSHDYDNGLADMLDVIGTNYRDAELLVAWQQNPTRKIVGTEQGHDLNVWQAARDNPQHAGQFLWSGVDYLGEAVWPNKSAQSGVLDRTGAARARTWQRQSWWSDAPMVRIVRAAPQAGGRGGGRGGPAGGGGGQLVANWTIDNPTSATEQNITVYSNCEEVELFLNGTSLGAKPRAGDRDQARTWRVAYAPGSLKAVAKNGGAVVAQDELKTSGPAAKIVLESSKTTLANNFDSVAIVTARVVDAEGVAVPTDSVQVKFAVEGAGKLIAVDNGVTASDEPFQAAERLTAEGDCIAIVRTTAPSGEFTLTASAEGLQAGTQKFTAVK